MAMVRRSPIILKLKNPRSPLPHLRHHAKRQVPKNRRKNPQVFNKSNIHRQPNLPNRTKRLVQQKRQTSLLRPATRRRIIPRPNLPNRPQNYKKRRLQKQSPPINPLVLRQKPPKPNSLRRNNRRLLRRRRRTLPKHQPRHRIHPLLPPSKTLHRRSKTIQ